MVADVEGHPGEGGLLRERSLERVIVYALGLLVVALHEAVQQILLGDPLESEMEGNSPADQLQVFVVQRPFSFSF